MKRKQVAFAAAVLAAWLFEAQGAGESDVSLAFRQGPSNAFSFDTGVVRGLLREGGKSRGLSSVVHNRTGTRLDGSVGLAGHYRVFSANRRYGAAAWEWSSEARLLSDGAVQVRWPVTAERPFELGAVYRWTAPNILEVETSVRAETNLPAFESFFASYFAKSFTNAMVSAGGPDNGEPAAGFVRADAKRGDWLAFPRDEAAWKWMRDGRWTIPPNPVDWVRMPPLARALGVRQSPSAGVSVGLSSSLKDCFAVLTPQEMDPHYSMYLSLFGRDLRPGETARAKVTLMVLDTLSEGEILKRLRTE